MAEQVESGNFLANFNFEDAVFILVKWKWIVMFFSLTIPIIALLMMLMVKPVYQATSLVTVKRTTPESETLAQSLVGTPQGLDPLNEELFIKSPMVLSDVVRELNYNVEFRKEEKIIDLLIALIKGTKVQKDFPMVVKRINLEGTSSGGVWVDFYTYTEFLVTNIGDRKSIGIGKIGQPFQSGQATFIIDDFPHKPQDKFILRYHDLNASAFQLASNTEINTLGRQATGNTMSLEISVSSNSASSAVDLANTIALAYMKRKLEEAGETISQVLRFIEDQTENLKDRTEKSIANVETYKEKEGLFFIDESAKSKLQSISELDLASGQMELQVSVLQGLLDSVRSGTEITSKQIMLINSTQTPVAGEIANQINQLQLDRKGLERKYMPQHPEMLANQGK
ncbi:MAG: Wzz/FepE/Etk N-terminal domain-containing protein, partial [Candidatus Helarchaeota archaeon]|nr:Wzz/FepE/Etk N-terminal domain-containing protein [Candidatus Helarchaeota archaeon]